MTHLAPEILDAYADGRLGFAEQTAAEAHLATCAQCQQTFASLTQMVDLLQAAPRVAPPPDLAARIIAELEPRLAPSQEQRPAPSRATTPNWARVAGYGIGVAVAWAWLIILGGETVVAAYQGGLSELAWFFQSHPEVLTNYPTEAFYALVETVPVVQLSLTGVVLVVTLWLMQRFMATLPIGSRA